jgi:hypothetical protein
MEAQELQMKIEKLKKAIQSETDPDVKQSFVKKLTQLESQIASVQQAIEKKEEKASAEENKSVSEAEEKIKKLEKAIANETDPDVKASFQKKLNQLKGDFKEVKTEIKEEKKEIAEQKQDIKESAQEVKKLIQEVKKGKAIKVRKQPIKKAAPVMPKIEEKKKERKKKLKSVISDLDALIEKNKKLKSKYGAAYKKTGKPTDIEKDAKRQAKPFGYRFKGKHDYRVPTEAQIRRGLKRGTIDYEGRPNRADVYVKRKVKLEDGGMADGGEMMKRGGRTKAELAADKRYKALKAGKRVSEDGNVYYESRPNRSDVSRKDKLENGGMMAKGGSVPEWLVDITAEDGRTHEWRGYAKSEDEALLKAEKEAGFESVESGINMLTDENGKKIEYKKGGKVKKKVGNSKEDKSRFAKPAGWRWKEEALDRKIIKRAQLSMQPSKKMRDKYPDLVYYEDRLNKADKKPTRTSAPSV